jgi:hypothetical protein
MVVQSDIFQLKTNICQLSINHIKTNHTNAHNILFLASVKSSSLPLDNIIFNQESIIIKIAIVKIITSIKLTIHQLIV